MLALLAMAMVGSLPSSSTEVAMVEPVRALWLDAKQQDGFVEVVLRGRAPQPVDVRYSVELTGGSTTRHSGSTRLASNAPVVLSRMRMSVGAGWCAKVRVKQGEGFEYTIQKGNCR